MKQEKGITDLQTNSKITELWLHYIWKDEVFSDYPLMTNSGKELKVLFSGWYNKGWGPDFKDARIEIDQVLYFGDVEIHIDESAWDRHSHQHDEAYNKVILHVFLNPAKSPAKNQLNKEIPSLCLQSANLEQFWIHHPSPNEVRIEELPGACGLMLTSSKSDKLKHIIRQAAENRLIEKSEPFVRILNQDDQKSAENHLFLSICKSTGYSANSDRFADLARKYPYHHIRTFFELPHRQSRNEILSRWFGYLGYLHKIDFNSIHQDARREWQGFYQLWNNSEGQQSANAVKPKTASRPLNSPVRRLIGLYYHLEHSWFQGLIKTWLIFLADCQSHLKNSNARTLVKKALDHLFPQPDWEIMNTQLGLDQASGKIPKTRFIGYHRQLIILANSILPFFLAWARIHGDLQLEKNLFSLFLLLPGEGNNRKTRFMENRLFKSFADFRCPKNLGYYQGLIQIHDDCCTSFYEGCDNCSLLKLLR